MDITRIGVPSPQTAGPQASEQALSQAQSGQLRGTPLILTSVSALAADAAEEMSFAASERQEQKLSARKAKDGSQMDLHLYKIAQKYLAQVPDLKSTDRLNAFAQSLLGNSVTSAKQLQSYMESFSDDVSHQYIALKYAREFIAKKGDYPSLLATLDSAIAKLEAEKGPQIRAGINVSKTAFAFEQKGLGDTQTLRDQYRDHVLDFSNVRAAAKYLLKSFGHMRFGSAIQFLEQGLSADLNAKTTSLPKAQLAAIAQDLGTLKQLRTALKMASTLFEKLKRERKLKKQQKAVNSPFKEHDHEDSDESEDKGERS